MDLFKFLKRKQEYNFEELLKKAATDPSCRVEFIKRILTENLIVLTSNKFEGEGLIKMEVGAKINIFSYADKRIPIFTSPERIFDKGLFKGNPQYFQAKGIDIFELLKGASLILNPYSDYGKEFNSGEIERLLDGSYFSNEPRQIVVEKATEVRIGHPVNYPTDVVKALIELYSSKPDVIAGYLAWIHDTATDVPPHYIFAIDTKGDYRDVVKKAGDIVQGFLGFDEIFDFIQISNQGGISDYFLNSTQPFYTKG